MSDEEIATMRTDEGFRDFTANKLRSLEQSILELSHAFTTAMKHSNDTTDRRLNLGEARMSRIETALRENTDSTNETKEGVKEVLDVVTALKGGRTVLGWAGKVFVWLGGLAGAWVAFSALVHDKMPWQ